MASTIYRITNFGGHLTQAVSGSGGSEYYATEGPGPYEWETARSLGLPGIGDFHPDPRAGFLGTVQAVQRVLEFPPNLVIWRVIYGTGGTFNFNTRIGSRTYGIVEQVRVPSMRNLGPPVGPPNWIETEPFTYTTRHGFMRVISVRYTGNVETVLDRFARNINKVYAPEGGRFVLRDLAWATNAANRYLQYQLADINVVTDSGNQTRIDTYFKHRSPLPAFPPGTGPNIGSVMVPALPANGEYVPSTADGTIRVLNPAEVYGIGEDLFWQ